MTLPSSLYTQAERARPWALGDLSKFLLLSIGARLYELKIEKTVTSNVSTEFDSTVPVIALYRNASVVCCDSHLKVHSQAAVAYDQIISI